VHKIGSPIKSLPKNAFAIFSKIAPRQNKKMKNLVRRDALLKSISILPLVMMRAKQDQF
jgi:hypothetical protein